MPSRGDSRRMRVMRKGGGIGALCGLVLLACGAPAGEECHLTGSGFSLRDPCRGKCLELWNVHCPDGSAVQPAMCADNKGCAPGACPAGQACYSFDDAFEEVSYCVPVHVCPVPAVTAEAVRGWELSSQQRAREQREKFGKIRRATEPRP